MLANEIFKKISKKQSLLERLLSIVRSLKTTISYNPVTSQPELGFGIGEIHQPEVTLDELLSYLETSDKICVVAIDEFQKIASFEEDNVEALLRTKIQHLKNTQFIFAGSERHLLEGIFSDPARPKELPLTSQDFIAKYNLKTASSVQTAVKGLTEKGILNNRHGTKRPTDLLFMLWLKKY